MTTENNQRGALSLWLDLLKEVLPRIDALPESLLRERAADLRELNVQLDTIAYRAACRDEIEGVPV